MRFSVIIPVYNIKEYIEYAVESVIDQSYKNYEIILVDDGSSDGSERICDELEAKYQTVRVIHKENGGLSSARNAGIKAAEGEYILFLDGDDYWQYDNGLYEIDKVISETETEIVEFLMAKSYPDTGVIHNHLNNTIPEGLSVEETYRYMIKNQIISGSACDKAYKRTFLVNNSLLFKKGIKSEDIEFFFRLLLYKPKIQTIDMDLYVYRQNRVGSITNNVTEKHCEDLLDTIESVCSIKETNMREILLHYAGFQYVVLYGNIFSLKDGETKDNLIARLKEKNWVLKYNSNKKVFTIYLIEKMIGFKLTGLLLSKYLTRK
ncbi:Glycosyl transferase family 2 [Pseudobutyrivibrio sp. YE44]|uniref:glycosyltransferase family 2 protein n=1 Tax=Pseudobutyrivibrio sp. YE44 TaxID=1520802 RepID=UPI0008909D91|nr:glycosyltransferase family 2 protein [Pseudobutyrivibrio sp. YE44]SDB39026.1 Glycosyl transferase family 2 [Pseudobutyrivibrio sp. YE44]